MERGPEHTRRRDRQQSGQDAIPRRGCFFQDDVAALGGAMALNYRTEPFSYRFQNQDYLVNDPALSPKGIARGQSDTLVSADPQTPVFVAGAGTPFRLRAL